MESTAASVRDVWMPFVLVQQPLSGDKTCCVRVLGLDNYSELCEARMYEHALPPRIRAAPEIRRREYVAARWCAHRAVLHVDPASRLSFASLLAEEHVYRRRDYLLTISHCASYVAAAAAPHDQGILGIGIDVEQIVDNETAGEIGNLVLTPLEWELDCCKLLGMRAALSLLFSAKESAYKALSAWLRPEITFQDIKIGDVCVDRTSFTFAVAARAFREQRSNFVGEGRFSVLTDAFVTFIRVPPDPLPFLMANPRLIRLGTRG